jgi:two-component system chemotaxis response regulator CheB
MAARDIVVIGTSAGGLEPLQQILARLPADIPGSLFLVVHLSSLTADYLISALHGNGPPVQWATDGEPIEHGRAYVAPADRHLFLNPTGTEVLFGPRECGARPAIDVLFRSAAVAYGNRVVGIVLSGMQDDGASGLQCVRRCGGVAIVMDPALAAEPEMPRNALRRGGVDYRLAPAAIGPLVSKLIKEPVAPLANIPDDIVLENQLARAAMTTYSSSLGNAFSSISCPECGGDLRRHGEADQQTYRCFLGHRYGSQSLLAAQRTQLESALWVALRALADRKRVLDTLADAYHSQRRPQLAEPIEKRAQESLEQYRLLRDSIPRLLGPEPAPD